MKWTFAFSLERDGKYTMYGTVEADDQGKAIDALLAQNDDKLPMGYYRVSIEGQEGWRLGMWGDQGRFEIIWPPPGEIEYLVTLKDGLEIRMDTVAALTPGQAAQRVNTAHDDVPGTIYAVQPKDGSEAPVSIKVGQDTA